LHYEVRGLCCKMIVVIDMSVASIYLQHCLVLISTMRKRQKEKDCDSVQLLREYEIMAGKKNLSGNGWYR